MGKARPKGISGDLEHPHISDLFGVPPGDTGLLAMACDQDERPNTTKHWAVPGSRASLG